MNDLIARHTAQWSKLCILDHQQWPHGEAKSINCWRTRISLCANGSDRVWAGLIYAEHQRNHVKCSSYAQNVRRPLYFRRALRNHDFVELSARSILPGCLAAPPSPLPLSVPSPSLCFPLSLFCLSLLSSLPSWELLSLYLFFFHS